MQRWPIVLMVCGFGAAAVLLGLLHLAELSPSLVVAATIGENLGIGVGSIGLGSQIAEMRRKRTMRA